MVMGGDMWFRVSGALDGGGRKGRGAKKGL